MTEQEMQLQIAIEQGKVNALRQEVAEINKEQEYWQQAHIRAAIAAMQGMIANPQTFEQLVHDKGYKEICGGDQSQIIAIASVLYANALIKELKKGVNDGNI